MYKKEFVKYLNVKEFERGLRLLEAHRPEKAEICFKKVLANVDIKEAWLNLGVAYKWLNRYDKVRECFLKAASPEVPFSDGTFVELWDTAVNNLGLLAYTFEQDDVALQFYKSILEKDPVNYEAIWNFSLASLRQCFSGKRNDLDKCWEYYSFRFKRKNAELLKNNSYVELWDCKSSHLDESIVILIEQGMGDAIMFARYLPYVAKKFKEVYVQCAPELDWIFKDWKRCRGSAETDAKYAVPMASLGKVCNFIPAGEFLADRFVPKIGDGALDIGIVWKGNPSHANDRNRSCNPHYFKRLKKYGNLYSIGQKDKNFEYIPISDWENTANILSKLDLVISVDTSIVHFCGAMGMPCWMLAPLYDTDFRWGDSSCGYDNVWYPSVDIIRNPNSWELTFDLVEERLRDVRSQQT